MSKKTYNIKHSKKPDNTPDVHLDGTLELTVKNAKKGKCKVVFTVDSDSVTYDIESGWKITIGTETFEIDRVTKKKVKDNSTSNPPKKYTTLLNNPKIDGIDFDKTDYFLFYKLSDTNGPGKGSGTATFP